MLPPPSSIVQAFSFSPLQYFHHRSSSSFSSSLEQQQQQRNIKNNVPAKRDVTSITTTTTTTTTMLKSSASNDNNDDDFMVALRQRIDEVNEYEKELPLVVLDSMLPRQVLNITIENELLMELIRLRIESETPYFGIVGMAQLKSTGQKVHLNHGVQVEIIHTSIVEKNSNNNGNNNQLKVSLKGTKLFHIPNQNCVTQTKQGWTQAKIEYINLNEQDEKYTEKDTMKMAMSMQRAKEFIDPNYTMKENQSLIDMWIELARENEHNPGQINQLLNDLGPIPSWKTPSDCAMWVGALINPIPPLGVAYEIRPKLLLAKTANERTQIALDGIWNSIQYMKGGESSFQQIKE